jgi:hypothetical protein
LLVEELPSDSRSRLKLTRDILRLLATLEFAQAKKRRGEHRLGSSGPPSLVRDSLINEPRAERDCVSG